MKQDICTVDEAGELVRAGRVLLLAADERVLRRLPQGDWIGGSIPYFIAPGPGGLVSQEKVFVTDISEVVERIAIVQYDPVTLARVYVEGPKQGFSFIIIPAASKTHLSFALNAPNYPDFGVRPLLGWIAGVHLDELGKVTPKVFNGQTGAVVEDGALVLQATLVPGKVAEIGFINLFEQGDGDTFTFPAAGFTVRDALVNGEKRNFAAYLLERKLDTRLPLVADYYGIMVNSSFQGIDAERGEVTFYAPVFEGVRYRHARPVADYVTAFRSWVDQEYSQDRERIIFSCNCILNYLYSELEGKRTDPFVGPMTFGEVAYQLLNQTLVFLDIEDA